MNSYTQLKEIFENRAILSSVYGILTWDMETHMPPKSGEIRAKQQSILSKLLQEQISNSNIPSLIESAKQEKLGEIDSKNLKLIEREVKKSKAFTKEFVAKLSEAKSLCVSKWQNAKKSGDFNEVKNELSHLINLSKERANILGETLGVKPYDALLDESDIGNTTQLIDPLFSNLKSFLSNIINKLPQKEKPQFNCEFPKDIQLNLSKEIMKTLGFDFNTGRLDESSHPFCGGGLGDNRLTTSFDERNITQSILSTVHETGHSMYNHHLPKENMFQPIAQYLGMTTHESQSLFYEKHIGCTKEFCQLINPLISQRFPNYKMTPEQLFNITTHAQPSFIRVNADELTYPLHIIIRYEIEKEIFYNDLKVDDIPTIWNDLYQKYLGITPKNHSEGCLQDIHWFWGYFGYFPSYTLGAIISAQLKHYILKDIPNFSKLVAQGKFEKINLWLKDKIHKHGRFYPTTNDLIKNATGEPINVKYFEEYIEKKYLSTL